MGEYAKAASFDNPVIMPRSVGFAGKKIEFEGSTKVYGLKYHKRVFTDGCVELVSYDDIAKKWVILCFPNTGNKKKSG
jgi:hypothetical protein